MWISLVNDLHVAVAIAPLAGAFALRELLSRRRLEADLSAREERAQHVLHEAKRAIHQALVAAETAQRSRDEFLARMSHELRTPLNAVIGFSRVLENNRAGNQRPEDIQLLGRVRAGGEQLLRLVEDVLDQSHISGGQLMVALDETRVVDVASTVVTNYRAAAAAKGLNLVAVLPDHAPPIPLDVGRFEQVVEHLVDNAVKFTSTGTVSVTLVTNAATMHPARLIIEDTGIGIPAERLEKVFLPFEQVETSSDRSYGGAGLGLPLARQLCEAMGCRLTVESEVGKGSRFTIRFAAGHVQPDPNLVN